MTKVRSNRFYLHEAKPLFKFSYRDYTDIQIIFFNSNEKHFSKPVTMFFDSFVGNGFVNIPDVQLTVSKLL